MKVNSDFQCVITDLSAKIWGMGCDGVGFLVVCCSDNDHDLVSYMRVTAM